MPPLPTADLDHILRWTPQCWESLRDTRLFITGGTGFFGSWLIESLLWAADRLKVRVEAVVLTRSPQSFAVKKTHLAKHPAVRLHCGDIRSFEFPDGQFTHVIHAGFPSSIPPSSARETLSLVLRGTERTLEFAEQSHANQLLFVSSGAVYGAQPPEFAAIPETYRGAPDPCNPQSAYGEAKRVAELMCCLHAEQTGLAVTIARCFAFVGPNLPLDAHFAIGNFLRDALHGGPIVVKGDGTTVRSYLYAADLAVWLWTLLVKGQSGRAYNVGSSQALSMAELADLVAREVAPKAMIQIQQSPDPARPLDRYVPNVSRAAHELQLIPRIPLPEALLRTAQWNHLILA
jgi:dTDP-glucose 4,6-dehydratase